MNTAFMMVLVTYDPRKEIRGNDYLAEKFLEEEQNKPLKDPALFCLVYATVIGKK